MTSSGIVMDISPTAVLELAALTGIPVDDEAMAARIAAGAGAAVAAVSAARASLQAAGGSPVMAGAPAAAADDALFGAEPADYLALLESLAGDEPR
jgi:hypothetical protein